VALFVRNYYKYVVAHNTGIMAATGYFGTFGWRMERRDGAG
jgi:hypothetical protein